MPVTPAAASTIPSAASSHSQLAPQPESRLGKVVTSIGSSPQGLNIVADTARPRTKSSRANAAETNISRMKLRQAGTEGLPANSRRPERRQSTEQPAPTLITLPSDLDIASQADRTIQANMLRQLESRQNIPLPVPAGSLIDKPLELYKQALNDPKVLAWFESKGLVLDTLMIHENSVSGNTNRNDPSSTETFTLCDTSGWWQVSAQVLAARQVLDLGNIGLPYVNEDRKLIPCNVILDFYGVVPPTSDEEAEALANRLKREGWPEITHNEKVESAKECHSVKDLIREAKARATLINELGELVKDKPDNMILSLSGQFSESAGDSPLAHKSLAILHHLNDFFALPEMITLCEGESIDCTDLSLRVCDNKIQVFIQSSQWYDLTDLVRGQTALIAPFNKLLESVKDTGNALYSPLDFDYQQILSFNGLGTPRTAGEVRNVIRWLHTSLPRATPLGDYGAELLANAQSLVRLTAAERAKVINIANGFLSDARSIIDELGADLLDSTSVEYRRNNADELLSKMLEKDRSDVCGRQLLQELNWYGAGETASPEHYQKLMLAAIKLEVDPDTPGKPGTIAGYNVYQPKNLGRDLTEVRSEIEQHLIDQKGVSSRAAPLIAHLFLADVAPEFLAQDLREGIQVGTATWMTLSLGAAIAEVLDPGSSRIMTTEQLIALALLAPTTSEQQLLFKSLAADTLMTWAVMNGVIQQNGESSYSSDDYTKAAKNFATQRSELSQALAGFKRELVTRREIAAKELRIVYPNTPERLLESTDGRQQPTEGRQLSMEEIRIGPRGIDEFGITYKDDPKSIIEAYIDSESSPGAWEMCDVQMTDSAFDAGWSKLPDLKKLLTESVDRFFDARKHSFVTATKSLIATLPLEDRQNLEYGEVKFFTLREETGKTKENETTKDQEVVRGRQGTLLRCELAQKVSYYEVFPGQMFIIKRIDSLDPLLLGGELKKEKERTGRGATVNVESRRGTEQPFDFCAYSKGTVPIPGAESKIIIEQLGSLAGETMQADSIPNSYFSEKTSNIVDKIVNENFLVGQKDFYFKQAKGQTTKEENDECWGKVKGFLLQLIPFVGCTDDLSSGDRIRIINGGFGCFADLVSGLSTLAGGVGKLSTVLKSVVPIRVKAFEALKIAGPTIVSAINPLGGVPDLVAGSARAVGSLGRLPKSGIFTLTRTGIGRMQTCLDRLRAYFGGFANEAARTHLLHQAGVAGTVDGVGVKATMENGRWYALDKNGKPIGRVLDNFITLTTASA